MSSYLYDQAFNRLEKARWNLNDDIPWDEINKDIVRPDHLKQVKVIAMAEFTSLDATMMFLRDFFDDIDFSCFMSIWYYEEMKHHYVLRRYLQAFGVELTAEELRPIHNYLPPGGIIPTITMHLVGEIKLHNWYMAVSELSPEPVSVRIFNLMAVDELRHGQIYYEFLEKYIAKEPSHLGAVLRMARFMFKEEKGNVKHPVPQLVEGNAEFNFNEALSGVFDAWGPYIVRANEKAEAMTWRFLSKLCREKIRNADELNEVIKLLRRRDWKRRELSETSAENAAEITAMA